MDACFCSAIKLVLEGIHGGCMGQEVIEISFNRDCWINSIKSKVLLISL